MEKLLSAGILFGVASPAFAHVGPGEYGSFTAGFLHPLHGIDHLIAIFVVGMWAGVLRGRAALSLPPAFMIAMCLGFFLVFTPIALPLVEPVIAASIVVLGLMIALAVRLDGRKSVMLVMTFALFHGYAHGGELGEAAALRFGLGFVSTTILLLCTGVAAGRLATLPDFRVGRLARPVPFALGMATAASGITLAFG